MSAIGLNLTNIDNRPRDKYFQFENDAGFTFDLSPHILDDYLYKAEQEEIVNGFDGTHRMRQYLIIAYVGTANIHQYAILKVLLRYIPLLKAIYE